MILLLRLYIGAYFVAMAAVHLYAGLALVGAFLEAMLT